jgi:uncharacterized protein YjiS (DUF1127 family)
MSGTQPAISCLGSGLARAGSRIGRLVGAIELALQVRRERRILLGLDCRMLKDMGLNGIAYAEASRRFWDLPIDRLAPEGRCRRRETR